MKNRLLIGISGSYCNHKRVLAVLEKMVDEYELTFVFTKNVSSLDTRYHSANEFEKKCQALTNEPIIHDLIEAEKIGPLDRYQIMAIVPCTANLLSRIVYGAYDCPVALCAKAMIRNQKNVVIGISSNDVLGISGINVMKALNMKHLYFLPFYQDEPVLKPNSCTSVFEALNETLCCAKNHQQIQPLLREKP